MLRTVFFTIKCQLILLLMVSVLSACGGGNTGSGDASLKILGEMWVLRGTQDVQLRYSAASMVSVYGFDNDGQKINYDEGRDWSFSDGYLKRTSNSRIPDFSEYQYLVSADGRFDFSAIPRNPGLTLGYHIYVDYMSSRPDRLVLSRRIGAVPRKVLCAGDSITAGAQTIASYFNNNDDDSYCGLLRRYLGDSSSVLNSSVQGGVLQTFRSGLDAYLVDPPEVAVIAFGMNDHTAGSQGLTEFRLALNEVVDKLLDHKVEVILLGFFQQNALWNIEDPAQTVAYNNAIKIVAADHNIPFVDVYEAFNQVATGRDLIDHLTSDFMHHPNNYGQRIYFSLLVPYFMTRDEMTSRINGFVPSLPNAVLSNSVLGQL